MTMTPSTMLELGTRLPSFQLFDVHGNLVSSTDIPNENGALIVFLCPHCPYVRHIRKDFSKFAQEYRAKGLPIVAINSNDNIAFPDDAPEGMLKEISQAAYTFPYLIDETQEVAKKFRAACTPDFFLFDRSLTLVYRGQFDSSRPSNPIPITGSDLRAAADAVLAGAVPSLEQKPSMGCNIKWKLGNEPDYFAVPVRTR